MQWAGHQKTSQQLLDSLAELAEGTTVMGKPQRTENRYGVIGSHRGTVTSCPPVPTKISSDDAHQGTNQSSRLTCHQNNASFATSRARETVEPNTVGEKCIQGVEVRTGSSPLSAVLIAIMSSGDENQAPRSFFGKKCGTFARGMAIPYLHIRPERGPLAVLCCDEGSARSRLPARVVDNKTSLAVRIPEKCVGFSHRSGIASPIPVAQVPQPKGLARLHLKAPPAINTTLANASLADKTKQT